MPPPLTFLKGGGGGGGIVFIIVGTGGQGGECPPLPLRIYSMLHCRNCFTLDGILHCTSLEFFSHTHLSLA